MTSGHSQEFRIPSFVTPTPIDCHVPSAEDEACLLAALRVRNHVILLRCLATLVEVVEKKQLPNLRAAHLAAEANRWADELETSIAAISS